MQCMCIEMLAKMKVFNFNMKPLCFPPFCRYWRFSEESRAVDKDYPRPISVWGSIPASPKGAFLSDDGGEFRWLKNTPITNVPVVKQSRVPRRKK